MDDEPTVRWFLEHGADPNAPAGEWDITPLSYAVMRAPLSTVKLLFEHGGSTAHGQLLNYAADRTDADAIPVLQFLVDHGAPINQWHWEDRPNLHCWAEAHAAQTPLYNAAEAGSIENVRFLLEHGADPGKRGIDLRKRAGYLPIDVAKRLGHTEIVELLSKAAAPPPPKTGFWAILGWK